MKELSSQENHTDQGQFLQQHVHHGSIFVLLEGLSLLVHLLCLSTALSLQGKSLCLTLHLKICINKQHLKYNTKGK